jgi:hypothetical protein
MVGKEPNEKSMWVLVTRLQQDIDDIKYHLNLDIDREKLQRLTGFRGKVYTDETKREFTEGFMDAEHWYIEKAIDKLLAETDPKVVAAYNQVQKIEAEYGHKRTSIRLKLDALDDERDRKIKSYLESLE